MSRPTTSNNNPPPSPATLLPSSLTAPGIRKNGSPSSPLPVFESKHRPLGKQWHVSKTAFRPGTRATQNSYSKRALERQATAATKAKEREMKEEKEAERQVRVWSAFLKIYEPGCRERLLTFPSSPGEPRGRYSGDSKRSKTDERRKLKRNDMNN
jgi:hypothetical protein